MVHFIPRVRVCFAGKKKRKSGSDKRRDRIRLITSNTFRIKHTQKKKKKKEEEEEEEDTNQEGHAKGKPLESPCLQLAWLAGTFNEHFEFPLCSVLKLVEHT